MTQARDSRLAHLSDEELRDLIERYYSKSTSVAALMTEYRIAGRPSSFVGMLPPQIHADLECQYCPEIKLVSARQSRDRVDHATPACPICGHCPGKRCACHRCKAAAADMSRKLVARQRTAISITFPVVERREWNAEEMGMTDALYLLTVFRHSVSEDLARVEPYASRRESLTPTNEVLQTMVSRLRGRGFITISLNSDLKAFEFDDDTHRCVGFYPGKVDWDFLPCLEPDQKRDLLSDVERIVREDTWPEGWVENAYNMWLQIAKAECFEYYELMLEQRGFEAEFGEKTHAVFDELLRHYSVGQVFHLTWQAVRDTSDYITKTRLPKYRSKNTFIGAIQRKADRARVEGWNIRSSRRDFARPQSILSSVFFDLFLKIGSQALDRVAPRREQVTGLVEA